MIIKEGGWYRDGQDLLWMDAEPVQRGADPPLFYLYRGGTIRRVYTEAGIFVREDGSADQAIPSWDLVVEILREAQPTTAVVDDYEVGTISTDVVRLPATGPVVNDHAGVDEL